MRWIREWWWAQQRAADLELLWPACKEQAPTLDHAKAAFMFHAIRCPCWVRHYGEDLWKAIDGLT